jgi:hypothetical protein
MEKEIKVPTREEYKEMQDKADPNVELLPFVNYDTYIAYLKCFRPEFFKEKL